MKTAIILAAGVGSRLRPLTETRPKCCVSVANTSLIRRVVGQLQANAPQMPIYIVVGYLADVVRTEVADLGATVHIVENADYASTNNMESCRMALETRVETGASLILNADCMYDDAIIAQMVAAEGNCIAVDTGVYIEENMKVHLVDGVVRHISKAIPEGVDVATSIDLYNFEPAELSALLAIMQGYRDGGDLNQWTEVGIDVLVKDASVGIVDIAGLTWIEIDNHEDLARAAELFPA